MAPAPTTRIRMGLSLLFLAVVLAFAGTTSRRLFDFPTSRKSLPRHHLLDLAQLLLAEEHLVADEEGRRAERDASDSLLGVLDQSALHLRFPGAGEQLLCVKAGGRQRLCRDFRIVHLLRLAPHVVEGGLDIGLEHTLELRGD